MVPFVIAHLTQRDGGSRSITVLHTKTADVASDAFHVQSEVYGRVPK